jgi:hypothetical protein
MYLLLKLSKHIALEGAKRNTVSCKLYAVNNYLIQSTKFTLKLFNLPLISGLGSYVD